MYAVAAAAGAGAAHSSAHCCVCYARMNGKRKVKKKIQRGREERGGRQAK